jgi:S-adenosylmethionine decarboxylase
LPLVIGQFWSDRAAFSFRASGMPANSGFTSLVGEDGMRQAALLRSDKGLGTPGTDRKKATAATAETKAVATTIADDDRKDHFVVRNGVRCAGAHLIIDIYGGQRLDDLDHIEDVLRRAVIAARATLLHIHLHHFEPNGGVSGVAVLAESHISIHTWPENGFAALDVFMCGNADPDACVPVFRAGFRPKDIEVTDLLRGRSA